jgi:ATP-dependent exoDNAse (exonuclease V) beta subunit
LIQLLTQGWDGHSQTVFLVGDPKQSIYLFRQARVERFIRTMRQRRLGDLELGTLRLTANFRSQSKLVHSFNAEFSQLFPQDGEDSPEEAPYVEVEPVRGSADGTVQSFTWHAQVAPSNSITEERRRSRRRLARHEALQIRRIIEGWSRRPLSEGREKPWQIAVLVRNRAHLTEIVSELKRNRDTGPVPFRAIDIEPLDERPEILDLFALTRSLLHPADRVSWLAVLRAPWCGLELADLQNLVGEDRSADPENTIEELILKRGQELSEDGCERLARIWPVLQAAIKQHSQLPLAEWVERTWRSLGGDAYLSKEQKTNVQKYFELLDDMEKQRSFDLAQLRLRIKSLYAESPAITGAVDLMTIHGSKGLEWDVVLVPGLERRSRANRNRLLLWSEMPSQDEQAAQVLLAPIAGKGHESEALNLWLNRIQRSREDAENRRLFYVACTRAREELHLFASPEQNQNGEIRQNAGSLLQSVWPIAEKHFVNVQADSKPLIAPVVVMPSADNSLILPGLAAETDEPQKAILQRLPLGFIPLKRFSSTRASSEMKLKSTRFRGFDRPEGSFEARALGNTIHLFLERIAEQLAKGMSAQTLLHEIENWQPRITAVLRSTGLSPRVIPSRRDEVLLALRNVLQDPEGLWILSATAEAFNEHPLRMWKEERISVRFDRTFRGGAEPLSSGDGYLWIIDYKTTRQMKMDKAEFFAKEQEKYAQQMMAYAHIMLSMVDREKIRLGLYYPMLPGLTWWALETK